MRRRQFLGLLGGAAAWPLPARAQQAAASRRLAIFSPFEPAALMREDSDNRYYRALFDELRRLGHVEGKNLTVERYGRERSAGGLAALAEEVVSAKPDVVFVVGPGAMLFKRAEDGIPVVALTGDPVAQGMIQSLAHPGGNITGVSVDTGPSIYGKRIVLLREMFPKLAKLGYLTLRTGQWEAGRGRDIRQAGEAVGVEVIPSLVDLPTGEAVYRDAIAQASRDGANAFMVDDNPDTMANRALIANLIATAAMPAIYPFAEFVEAGGLMAYSYDLVELNKRVASNIDGILRGANPGDIPFYQASKFELSINLKAARALGLDISPTLLATADNVIE
jgi:putative ABC transport system substrate-binding protein